MVHAAVLKIDTSKPRRIFIFSSSNVASLPLLHDVDDQSLLMDAAVYSGLSHKSPVEQPADRLPF